MKTQRELIDNFCLHFILKGTPAFVKDVAILENRFKNFKTIQAALTSREISVLFSPTSLDVVFDLLSTIRISLYTTSAVALPFVLNLILAGIGLYFGRYSLLICPLIHYLGYLGFRIFPIGITAVLLLISITCWFIFNNLFVICLSVFFFSAFWGNVIMIAKQTVMFNLASANESVFVILFFNKSLSIHSNIDGQALRMV